MNNGVLLRPRTLSMFTPQRRRWRWRLLLGAVALLCAVLWLWSWRALPQLPLRSDRPVRGAFHVHAIESHDSHVTVEQYAQAARAHGLDFVVLADHDVQDGQPRMVNDVLIVPQAELNTPLGHLVSLGASRALTPEERSDAQCLSHVTQLGGGSIAAHPTSRRRPWVGPTGDLLGIEVQNTASTFEAAAGPAYAGAVPLALAYAVAPRLALAQLYGRDAASHAAWDHMPSPAIGLCGIDAHGWLGAFYDTASWHMVLPSLARPHTVDAAFANDLLAAIKAGRFYMASGLWDGPLAFDLIWRGQGPVEVRTASAGDTVRHLPEQHSIEVCLGDAGHLPHPGLATTAQLVLLHDGEVAAQGAPPCLRVPQPAPGLWRAELRVMLPTLGFGSSEGVVAISNRIQLR